MPKSASPSESPSVPHATKISFRRHAIRYLVRILLLFVAVSVCYSLSIWVLGRIPVNREFVNAGLDGVEILLINNGVHADLVVPINHPSYPIRRYLEQGNFQVSPNSFDYAVIGWGSRKFYLETESWDDLRLSTVAYALSGFDRTTVHVQMYAGMDWPTSSSRKIRIRADQFAKLGEHIVSTFRLNDQGKGIPIAGAHYRHDDAFFEGKGSYHLFQTCNVWVGQGLKKAGVRVGVWTVTPNALFASLPEDIRQQKGP